MEAVETMKKLNVDQKMNRITSRRGIFHSFSNCQSVRNISYLLTRKSRKVRNYTWTFFLRVHPGKEWVILALRQTNGATTPSGSIEKYFRRTIYTPMLGRMLVDRILVSGFTLMNLEVLNFIRNLANLVCVKKDYFKPGFFF